MNKKQLIVMWFGIAIFIIVALTTPTRFGPLRHPKPDYGPLLVRAAITVVVTVGLLYTLKNKKKDD